MADVLGRPIHCDKKKGYREVIHFPLEFETLLALQAVHVEVG